MSGEVRTHAIILQRRASSDDSLFLQVLCENGQVESFRLPGILKSRKRSAFHFAPGCVCRVRYHSQAARALIPQEMELVFSPFTETQEYFRLSAVAEMVKLKNALEPGSDAAQIFCLMRAFLETIPNEAQAAEQHTDHFYWEALKLMGFAHEPEATFVAYDLTHGYLSERDAAALPDSGLRLPRWWIKRERCGAESESAKIREKIRYFLANH